MLGSRRYGNLIAWLVHLKAYVEHKKQMFSHAVAFLQKN